jgi:hypothetical protein
VADWLPWELSLVGLVAAVAAAAWWWFHRRSPRHLDDGEVVVAVWADTAAALSRVDLGRRSSETPAEHAVRLSSLSVGTNPELHRALDAYRDLAGLAGRALYARQPCDPVDARNARQLAETTQHALRTRADRSQWRAVAGVG